MKLAAEHEFGIYEKTVANNPDISAEDKAYILEQLKANFTGECSEVVPLLQRQRQSAGRSGDRRRVCYHASL